MEPYGDGVKRQRSGESGAEFHSQTHTKLYLSGGAQWLESIRATGHDISLVHQQDSYVVLTFDL